MVLRSQVYRTLDKLNLTQLKQLNREFGLPFSGKRATLINRLIIGPKQIGGARTSEPDTELRLRLGLDNESNETQWPWGPHAQIPSYYPEALEGYLLSYLNESGQIPESVTEEAIKADFVENELDLKLNYSPSEWYQILLAPIKVKKPPFEALPAYARRFAKTQLSQLSYPQLRELQKNYPNYFDEFLPKAIKKMERLEKWLADELPTRHLYSNLDVLSQTQDLRLETQKISKIPPEIGQLTNLENLSFYINQIREIPPEIGQLTKLRSLTLQNNQLHSFPENLNLPKLEYLNLRDNQLKSFPENLNLPNLESLYLRNNELESFPKNLNLPKLKDLDLVGNPLISNELDELNRIYHQSVDRRDVWKKVKTQEEKDKSKKRMEFKLRRKEVPRRQSPL